MTQKQKFTWKSLLNTNHLSFAFAIITFILFMMAVLVIGYENQLSGKGDIITLKVLNQWFVSIRQAGLNPPAAWVNSYNLMVSGLGISGIGTIVLFLNLLPIKKCQKAHPWLYWTGIFLELTAMTLMLAGESLFVDYTLKSSTNSDLKFSDCFGVSRFVGMILCSTVLPLTLIISAVIMTIKKPQIKMATKK